MLKHPLKIEPMQHYEDVVVQGVALLDANSQLIANDQTYYPHEIDRQHAEQIVGMSQCVLLLAKVRSRIEAMENDESLCNTDLCNEVDAALEAQGINWMEV